MVKVVKVPCCVHGVMFSNLEKLNLINMENTGVCLVIGNYLHSIAPVFCFVVPFGKLTFIDSFFVFQFSCCARPFNYMLNLFNYFEK